MKNHLIFYGILITAFILYNFFFEIRDPRTNTAVNILFAAVIFGYISYMAYVLLKKMKK